jgi:hypothetical protein
MRFFGPFIFTIIYWLMIANMESVEFFLLLLCLVDFKTLQQANPIFVYKK